ncbi:MAG: hypothetical protein QFB86_01745 [Patescibacteria group bacterium]|nr:hypothetical protein [Patescibacteria group bacterium]
MKNIQKFQQTLTALLLICLLSMGSTAFAATSSDEGTQYIRADCNTRVKEKYVNNASSLRAATDKLIQKRLKTLLSYDSSVSKSNTLTDNHRTKLSANIDIDTSALSGILNTTSAESDVTKLAHSYCAVMFDYRIYTLVRYQVIYVAKIDAYASPDKSEQAASNQNVYSQIQKLLTKTGQSKKGNAPAIHARLIELRDGKLAQMDSAATTLSAEILATDAQSLDAKPEYFKTEVPKKITELKAMRSDISNQIKLISKSSKKLQAHASRYIGRKAIPSTTVHVGDMFRGPASTYGWDPVTHYKDPGDNNKPALSSASNDNPGIAIYNSGTLGGYWQVKAPNGTEAVVQQTDLGPSANRSIDVNSVAARTIFHYPQGNSFPTDEGEWSMEYLGKDKPAAN